MNIIYLITGLGGGGAEKVVVDLATRMDSLGHQVKIAYLKGEVVVKPQTDRIELIYLGLENLKQAKLAYHNYKSLLDRFEPDVVHAHMVHANIFARLSRKFRPIAKLICTAHSNNEGGGVRMLAYRLTHTLSDVTTNVSYSAARSFEKKGAVPKNEIETVYNGIDLGRFYYNSTARENLAAELNLDYSNIFILAVGRFHSAKDYPNLLHAFSKVSQKNSMVKLIIAGDGEERHNIEQLISSLKLDNDVHVLGRRDDIPDLMSAADIFVLSSSFEGFGLVVAEAMACNTFVVATDCGGVKEVMGQTGICCPSKNSQQLALAIIKAIQIPLKEKQINNLAALKYVEDNFDLNLIEKKWLRLYES